MTGSCVHIVPLAFEIDRVVLPAIERCATKVYVMLDNNAHEHTEIMECYKEIKQKLEKNHIEIHEIKHDRNDIKSIINTIGDIIDSERDIKIEINLSSGSTIQSIISMSAAIKHNQNNNVTTFYATAEEYPPIKYTPKGIKEIKEITMSEVMNIMTSV